MSDSDVEVRPRLATPFRPSLVDMPYTPPPQVVVEATYPASDGSLPELITVRWDLLSGRPGPAPTDIAAAIAALADVPRRRFGPLPCSHE